MANDLKVVNPAKYENRYNEQAKQDITKLSKKLLEYKDKPYMFKRILSTICEKMYAEGMAAALGGDVVEAGRCINIDYGEKYVMTCPYCGEMFDINIEAMLPEEDGYGVKTK